MTSRLQTRCLVSSAIAHALLCVVLFFVPGLRSERPRDEPSGPGIQVIAGELVDAALAAGMAGPPGPAPAPSPRVQPRPPAPAPSEAREEPATRPVREETPKPERPAVEAPKVRPPEKAPPKPTPKPPPRETPRFDFTQAEPLKRPPPNRPKAEPEQPTRPSPESVQRSRLKDIARSLAKATGSLSSTRPSSTVQVRISATGDVGVSAAGGGGGGGGGASTYAFLVRNAFDRAWVAPRNVSDDLATTDLEVVVRRDGRILSSRIVKRSGVAALDRSVQETLARVTQVPAFEAGATEETRTFVIGFNLRGKGSF